VSKRGDGKIKRKSSDKPSWPIKTILLVIDFAFVDKILGNGKGRKGYTPSGLFKCLLIVYLGYYSSIRRMVEKLKHNQHLAKVIGLPLKDGYLKDGIKLNGVKFYEDKLIRGTASALYAARDFIDRNFILVYGDLFFDILNFSEIMKKENSIGIAKVKDVSRYGEVLFEGGYLTGIREKTGFGEGFVNAGIYHLTPTILDCVDRIEESERKEYELTDSVQTLNEKEKVKGIPLNGYWNDIGYPWIILMRTGTCLSE
jgi:NDP-sugar pyrophosphorylase family protein